jgi:hypothetical protein
MSCLIFQLLPIGCDFSLQWEMSFFFIIALKRLYTSLSFKLSVKTDKNFYGAAVAIISLFHEHKIVLSMQCPEPITDSLFLGTFLLNETVKLS